MKRTKPTKQHRTLGEPSFPDRCSGSATCCFIEGVLPPCSSFANGAATFELAPGLAIAYNEACRLTDRVLFRHLFLMNPSLLSLHLVPRHAWLLAAALLAFACCLLTQHMPIEWGYENSLVENIQLVVLAGGVFLCATANNHRTFYQLAAFIVVLFMLREVSFGRTIFFPVEGQVNTFYKWKELPYGWLAHWVIGAYITALVFFFLRHRLWNDLREILLSKAIPVWGCLFMLVGAGLTAMEEDVFHDYVAEEIGELGMYLSFVYLLLNYTRRTATTH